MEYTQAELGEQHADWDDMDEASAEDDFYDDLAHLYLFSGEVWPDGLSAERLPRLEQALRIGDFFEDIGADLDK